MARRSRTRILAAFVAILALAGVAAGQVNLAIKLNGTPTPNDCLKIVDRTHATSAGGPCGTASSVPYTGVTSVPTASILGRTTAGTGAAEALTASAVRTLLGLVIGTNVEAWDADLDSLAAVTPSANALTILAHTFAQIRSDLGLVIGTNVEAWDADLDTLAGKTIPSGATLADTSSAQVLTSKSFMGRTDGSNPCTGCIGEILSSVITSPISLTDNTPINLTSLSLTAGVWDCQADFMFINTNASTSVTQYLGSISGTSITVDVNEGNAIRRTQAAQVAGNNAVNDAVTPIVRFALSGTTTKYAVARAFFTAGTLTVQGAFRCTRAG